MDDFSTLRKFDFNKVDDLINISLHEDDQGCRMVFIHSFSDNSLAVDTAAGWHVCLEVLGPDHQRPKDHVER